MRFSRQILNKVNGYGVELRHRPWWWFPGSKTLWSTWRWPFTRTVYIFFPRVIDDPLVTRYKMGILQHEMVHVRQWAHFLSPLGFLLAYVFFPLPVLLSGRYLFIEGPAFEDDVFRGRYDAETATQALWRGYVWPWPRSWMLKRFKKVEERRAA